MLTTAALCGLAAHPAMGGNSADDIVKRAVDLATATAKELESRFDFAGPDSGPGRSEPIELRVDDEIARVVNDLVERVGALETSLGVNEPTKGE